MSRIIDISQQMCPEMVVYPGDPRFQSRSVSSFKMGNMCEVSELTMGSHCGTHIDAPLHMIKGGAGVESMPLDCFYGPCRVLTIAADVINEKMLSDQQIKEGERILLRTDPKGKHARSGRFNPAVLSMRAAQYLAQMRVRLVGIDSPTVENMELCDGEVHRTLMDAGVAIVEGLCLQGADKENYILSALPLSLTGENGAPCRAVLIDEEA
ncbi:MAG: cyclase family protein [Clostridiales bacterium]|nr:cyclase family protein [Clostridiales bacterium]